MATRLRLKIRDEHGHERLDADVVERLLAGLDADSGASLVTLESDGPSFCEGMDLSGLVERDGAGTAALRRFEALLRAIERTPRPVVALVNGPALGGGVGLLAAADVVIAAPHATFGMPEALFGLIPAVILPVVARRVGPARARWLALSALTVSAAEAWRIGLVDEVSDDPEAALDRYARRFDRIDLRAVAEVKRLAAAHDATPQGYHERAALAFERLLVSAETRARVNRFLAGQTPWPDGGAQ